MINYLNNKILNFKTEDRVWIMSKNVIYFIKKIRLRNNKIFHYNLIFKVIFIDFLIILILNKTKVKEEFLKLIYKKEIQDKIKVNKKI